MNYSKLNRWDIILGITVGMLLGGFANFVSWTWVNYNYSYTSGFPKGGGAIIIGLFGAVIGGLGGIIYSSIILVNNLKYWYGSLIGFVVNSLIIIFISLFLDGITLSRVNSFFEVFANVQKIPIDSWLYFISHLLIGVAVSGIVSFLFIKDSSDKSQLSH